jgi:hypothetical protein
MTAMPIVPLASKAGLLTREGSGGLYPSVREALVHDAPNNRSIFALEIWDDGAENRRMKVGYRNHGTGVTSALVDVGITGLADDNHGVPSICKGPDGHWYVFGAAHITTIKYASTDAADDLSVWTSRGTATDLDGAYPHPVVAGSKLYLLYLRRNLSTDRGLKLRVFTASGGVLTPEGASLSILDLDQDGAGPDERVYLGNCILVGTEIWFVAQRSSPNDDDGRRDVYFARYDTATGALKNYDGSVTIASGSLPVTRATADASFLIFDHTGTRHGTDIPVWFRDVAGHAHVFFADGEAGGPFRIKMMFDTGSGWQSEDTGVDAYGDFATFAAVLRRDGAILLYHNDPSEVLAGAEWYGGTGYGHAALTVRSPAGAWSSPARLLTGIGKPIGRFTPVIDPHPSLRVLMSELPETADDSAAPGHRVFGHGARRFLAPAA